jgi:hypothetical protein
MSVRRTLPYVDPPRTSRSAPPSVCQRGERTIRALAFEDRGVEEHRVED